MANKNCEKEVLVNGTTVSDCNAPFSICLPFGGNLSLDGTCLKYTPPTEIPEDGEYNGFVIKDGCIQGVVAPTSPLYTSNICATVPNPCDCEGGSSDITPSTLDGNMLTLDALNRPLVQLHYEAGDGISITGKGTTASPLVISYSPTTETSIISGTPAVLTVTKEDDSTVISHVECKSTTRTINGMTFDSFGHLYSYTDPGTATTYLTSNDLIGSGNITITKDQASGMLTFDLADTTIKAGSYVFGGYTVSLTEKGIIMELESSIAFPEGSYDLGDFRVTFNSHGSATAIAAIDYTGIARHSVTKKVNAGTTEVSFSFTLAEATGLRVSIKSKAIPECTVTIDGNIYTGDKIGDAMYEVVTNATFSASSHTVVVKPASAFSGVAIIDVVLNTVV